MSITEYIKLKYTILDTTAIIRGGKHYRLVNGKEIPEAQFKAMHVLPTVLNGCKENPCRKGAYLL